MATVEGNTNLDSSLRENRVFPPPAEFAANAHIKSLAQYEAVLAPVATAISAAPLVQADSALTLTYDQADQLQWLGYRGVLTDARKAALQGINSSPDLQKLLAEPLPSQ